MAKVKDIFKKYTMIFVLILVIVLFTIGTGGKMLLPANINNLISQNAYVFVLATGMLLCILTGGNIDLSVGSVVCFVGAIGGSLMVNKNVSVPVAILVMIVVGLAIGAWQGFWIAYVKIPPFIVTLAGMFVFRGLSNVILNGLTISPMPDNYLKIFNSYVPDFFGGDGFNITCMLAGVLACVIFIALQIKNRKDRAKKGYELNSLSGTIAKTVVICAAVLAFMYKLALHKGIPYVLVWVVVIVLIYSYITQLSQQIFPNRA